MTNLSLFSFKIGSVRIGNAAYFQKQNDIYGILMDAIHFQILKFQENKHQHEQWIFLFWCFLILFHAFDVYVTNRFLGKKWKKKQTRLLMELQRNKILELKKEHYCFNVNNLFWISLCFS